MNIAVEIEASEKIDKNFASADVAILEADHDNYFHFSSQTLQCNITERSLQTARTLFQKTGTKC